MQPGLWPFPSVWSRRRWQGFRWQGFCWLEGLFAFQIDGQRFEAGPVPVVEVDGFWGQDVGRVDVGLQLGFEFCDPLVSQHHATAAKLSHSTVWTE
jgi:hypothetical protein